MSTGRPRFPEAVKSAPRQGLQIDGDGVVLAAADGMRPVCPVPEPGVPTMPVKGARRPLEWDGEPDSAMTVTAPLQTR